MLSNESPRLEGNSERSFGDAIVESELSVIWDISRFRGIESPNLGRVKIEGGR